jgi:hypothetical protein
MNNITSKIKKRILARNEIVLIMDKFKKTDIHSINTIIIARLKIITRYLLSASAESRKINAKKILYKIRCHSIGKSGIINIVKITNNNTNELLVVKNLVDMFENKFIF